LSSVPVSEPMRSTRPTRPASGRVSFLPLASGSRDSSRREFGLEPAAPGVHLIYVPKVPVGFLGNFFLAVVLGFCRRCGPVHGGSAHAGLAVDVSGARTLSRDLSAFEIGGASGIRLDIARAIGSVIRRWRQVS
jgi:hypothetical protein